MRSKDHLSDPFQPQVTQSDLVRDLLALGIKPGQTLLVNARVSSIGLVDGGAPAVLAALRAAVGDSGNIVTPTMTMENSVTSRAHKKLIARMTADEATAYRQPGFDRDTTPSTSGGLGEALRTTPGARRSDHPQSSFGAIGPAADELTAGHRLKSHLGERSPLATLYAMDACCYWAWNTTAAARFISPNTVTLINRRRISIGASCSGEAGASGSRTKT
jgi:aminoglycoside 3-N-acetyltransferase